MKTGRRGCFARGGAEWEIMRRKSKDGTDSKEGRKFIEMVEYKDWYILNATKEGNEDGE